MADKDLKPMFADVKADLDIAIIGSGPAGLSAAGRAAELGCKYVLFEAESHASDTIYKYQKGKHVMAEPGFLPLRSKMSFDAGKREEILGIWDDQLEAQKINIQYKKKVEAIQKLNDGAGPFEIKCEDGTVTTARTVILGIGLQGNIRKLGCPGEDLPNVQYTLSDPEEFKDETIIVVGAGDAAIENALGLMPNNTVILVNRRDEFARCKEGNLNQILAADRNEDLQIFYNTSTVKVVENTDPQAGKPMSWVYKGPDGEKTLPIDRMIGRLGATPPRKLVESFGVTFPNNDPSAVPALSEQYESNVPGLFIVGALGGYPLIKQAMNQGHEVVDTIMGLPVVPADEPLLAAKFAPLGPDVKVSATLDMIQNNVPVYAQMTRLQLREFMLESSLHTPADKSVIFKKGDYTSTFFAIVRGSVGIELLDKHGKPFLLKLDKGNYFGEMGLISGRRRTATVYAGPDCVLVETPRKAMLKLIASVDSVRRTIDETFVRRAVATNLAPQLDKSEVDELVDAGIEVRSYVRGDRIYNEGEVSDGLYLIRRGSVAMSKTVNSSELVLSYISAGNHFGEYDLLENSNRREAATATVLTEVLVINGNAVKRVLAKNLAWRTSIQNKISSKLKSSSFREAKAARNNDLIKFLMENGMGDATNALVIDESLCVQCDNCEKACADTHNGMPRLDRDSGPTFQNYHLPHSCRHCEQPHCMKDCPPDAIRRNEKGEVAISDSCIGCGNCAKNCPYDAIELRIKPKPKRGGLISWLLFGLGDLGTREAEYSPDAIKKAVKCDLCATRTSGPACVAACPTGAAFRISPEILLNQEDPTLV